MKCCYSVSTPTNRNVTCILCVISVLIQRKWKNITNIQGDSDARGPKLLSIKNYVIEIMT